ncbi:MAG: mechanosensitive ion channel family protein [Deltaproteobacteria bacterium]|nr:mechanosensitive ion channel family protein [Deltaproteobacteria bacterium]
MLAVWVVRAVALNRLRVLAEKTKNPLDDVAIAIIERTKLGLAALVAISAGASTLTLHPKLDWAESRVATTAVLIQIGIWLSSGIKHLVTSHNQKRIEEGQSQGAGSARVLGVVARITLWVAVLLLALDSFGINVSALVAGLGIGGIAVALAVQNILGDIFASLSITLDKPFEIGDFIVVGELMGTVETVGIKTTRVRSLSGEMLVFSNADLLGARIRNYKRMEERRAVFTIGVTYQTKPDELEAITDLIKDAIESQDDVRFDRAHFKSFGSSSLDFEAVYYLTDPDYNRFMDVQEAINLRLFRNLNERGIDFAFPTRTLFIESGELPEAA